MMLSQLCMMLAGEKGSNRRRKVKDIEEKVVRGNREHKKVWQGFKRCQRFWLKIKGRDRKGAEWCPSCVVEQMLADVCVQQE